MDGIYDRFCSNTSGPERFIEAQHDLAVKFKDSTKELYDLSRDNGLELIDSALPELIVQNFDDEQIWQELELQSGPSMQELIDVVSKLSATQELSFETVAKQAQISEELVENEEFENDADEDVEGDDDDDAINRNVDMDESEELKERKGFDTAIDSDASDEERELEALLQKAQAMPHSDDDEDDDDEQSDHDDDLDFNFETSKEPSSTKESNVSAVSKKKTKSIVDDKFFSLSDMAEFLEQEDAREERRIRQEDKGGEDEEESSEDEDIDLDEDDEDESGAKVKYSDFFDPPPNDEAANKKKKGVRFDMDEARENEGGDEDFEGDEDASDDGDDDDEEMDQSVTKDLFDDSDEGEELSDIFGGAKSSFEKRQDRLKQKIKEMEETTTADKPWQLKGEIKAADRPENSLLQEDLDFDSNARAAPVITEESTKSLEDIVKQRIKDKAWDDVERKEKKTDDVFEFKKKVVLDQEKSKMSLSQVYEEEYIKQQQEEEEQQEDPKHESIQKSMQALFVKLDALSNFHYTPKPAAPDIKIVSNLPSISMEEALPVAASEATTLAPEEIKDKKKEELKGDTEKTKTDKKRDRRKKKNRQAAYFEEKEKKATKIAVVNPNSKIAKKKAVGDVKKLVKTSSNVSLMKEKVQGSLTSSSKFFSQLQDQVSSHIAAKKAEKVSKEIDKTKKSSAKLKL